MEAEFRETKLVLGCNAVLQEEVDYRVELIDDEIQRYNTQQNEIAARDEPEVFFPLGPQNTSDSPLHILILLAPMQHVHPAGHERDDAWEEEYEGAADESCFFEEED